MRKTLFVCAITCLVAVGWGLRAQQATNPPAGGKEDSAKAQEAKSADAAHASSASDDLGSDTSAALYYPWAFADLQKIAATVARRVDTVPDLALQAGKTLLMTNNGQEIGVSIRLWRYLEQLHAGAKILCTQTENLEAATRKAIQEATRPQITVPSLDAVIAAATSISELAKTTLALFQAERSFSGDAIAGMEAAYRDMVAAQLRATGWGIYVPQTFTLNDGPKEQQVLQTLGELATSRKQLTDFQALNLPQLRKAVDSSKLADERKSTLRTGLDTAAKACDHWVQAIDSFNKVVGLDHPLELQKLVEGAVCEGVPCLVLRVDAARGNTYTKKGAWSGTHIYAGDFLAASYELYSGDGKLASAGVVTTNDIKQSDSKEEAGWVFHEVQLP